MLSRRKNHWKVFAGTARFKKCVRCSLGDCCRLLFSCSVVSSPLQPHGLQHIRLPCPSLSPGVCSNSCPLSWWCRPTISSSVVPFSCLQSFSASGSFLINWLFASGGQSFGALVSSSVLPVNIQIRRIILCSLPESCCGNSSPSLVTSRNGWAGFTKGQTSVQNAVPSGNIRQQTFLSLFGSLIPVGSEVLPKLEVSALWKMRHIWDTEGCTGNRRTQSNAPCSWRLGSNAMKGHSGACVSAGRKLFPFTSCLSSLRMQVFILRFNSHGDPKGQKFLSQSRRGLESLQSSS